MKHNIVTIGGGNGSSMINEALLRTGCVQFIHAIAAVFDNGGATNRRRLDSYGNEIAYSDAIRIMISLINPNNSDDANVLVIKKWLLHRDSRNTVLGHEITNRFFNEETGFSCIEKDLNNLAIPLKGVVLPSSTHPAHIVFTTRSGMKYKGEHLLDEQRTSIDMVDSMFLYPHVPAYPPTIEAIRKSKIIFLSCGSMYGSLLCNFLPKGMREAMQVTKAKVYLITNLFSTRNETHSATPTRLANLIKEFTGKKIHGLIVPKISRREFEKQNPEVSRLYRLRDSSFFMGWENDILRESQKSGFEIITHDAIRIINIKEENKFIVRHDPIKLAVYLTLLLNNEKRT